MTERPRSSRLSAGLQFSILKIEWDIKGAAACSYGQAVCLLIPANVQDTTECMAWLFEHEVQYYQHTMHYYVLADVMTELCLMCTA